MTPRGRSDRWWLLVITTGALLLRLGVVILGDRDALGFNDQLIYHHIAEGIVAGDGYQAFGEPTLRWPPAYPFLLSLVYRVTGVDPTAGFVLNAVVSTAAVALVMLIARKVAGRRTAIVAGVALALLPGQWLFASTLLTEPLAALQILAVLAVAVWWRPSPRAGVVVGCLVAFAALTRGEGPLLAAIPLAVWWSRSSWRQVVSALAVAAVVAGALVTPWALRNQHVAGQLVGLSLNGSETLYAGHNPLADGGATYVPPEVFGDAADLPIGPQRELEMAERARDAATSWALDNPRRELELIPLRLLHLVAGDGAVVPVWIEAEVDALAPLSGALDLVADVAWFVLLALLVVAAFTRGRRWHRIPWLRGALVLPVLSLGLYGVLLYGNFRYRIPYEPLLVLVAASSFVRPQIRQGVEQLDPNAAAVTP